MPIDPGEIIGTIERTVGIVPAAGLAIIMLVGPTTVWLIWRLVVQPRTNRFAERGVDLLWICERCRSANEVRVSRCYSCGFDREAMSGDLHVLDGDGVVVLASDGSATVRSPGGGQAPAGPAPAPMPTVSPLPAVSATDMGTRPVMEPRPMVPVGPGRPDPAALPEPTAEPAAAGTARPPRARRPRKAAVTIPPTDPPEA